MKKMYLRNGQVVFLYAFLSGEALIKDAVIVYDEDEDHLEPTETMRLVHPDELYDKPPVAVIAKEIAEEQKRLDDIRAAIKNAIRENRELLHEIARLKNEREELLKRAKLTNLDKFINGGITHYVQVEKYAMPRIIAFQDTKSMYTDNERGLAKMRMLVLYGSSKGDLEWNLNTYSDLSGSSWHVIPCTSLEEAERVLREEIVKRMETTVSDELAKCALENGVEIPKEYTTKLNAQKREIAQNNVESARRSLNAALAKLDMIPKE